MEIIVENLDLEVQKNEFDLGIISLGEASQLTKGIAGGRHEFCGGLEFSVE
jgi:hypothetical protein